MSEHLDATAAANGVSRLGEAHQQAIKEVENHMQHWCVLRAVCIK